MSVTGKYIRPYFFNKIMARKPSMIRPKATTFLFKKKNNNRRRPKDSFWLYLNCKMFKIKAIIYLKLTVLPSN